MNSIWYTCKGLRLLEHFKISLAPYMSLLRWYHSIEDLSNYQNLYFSLPFPRDTEIQRIFKHTGCPAPGLGLSDTLHLVRCTVHSVECTVQIIHCTIHSVQVTVHGVLCTLH